MKRIAALLLFCALVHGQTPVESLRSNLAYLASDELEGRATPSRGLDLAADFIADQFRQARLEPAGARASYFQVARFKNHEVRNVAGVLTGSDPELKHQYVMLSAHYDHLGRGPKGIFHGANDNASGTVSVIEIARELAALPVHPKRSILFVAFFGEEEGLIGSSYYASHPLVPLKDTVAEINLEQIGRTDDNSGPKVARFAFTGPSYSDIPAIMGEAALAEGVKVYSRNDSDSFFDRSDNLPFARKGIPDTTIVVAFEYPDYHDTGDTIDKINFPNMALVDKAIAAGIERLADEPGIPHWKRKAPLVP